MHSPVERLKNALFVAAFKAFEKWFFPRYHECQRLGYNQCQKREADKLCRYA